MELTKQNRKQEIKVEELISHLKGRRTITPLFRVPLSYEQTHELLYAFYRTEVEVRRKILILDDDTKKNLVSIARHLTSDTNKMGIMLCGACGNGKTTFLMAIQNMINWLRDGLNCFQEPDWVGLNIIKAKVLVSLAKEDYSKYQYYVNYPKILAIDDFGEEPREIMDYGNVTAPVIDLIESRYDLQLPLYITSNKSPETISKEYGDRIGDRLAEMVDIIVFDKTLKESYRKIKK